MTSSSVTDRAPTLPKIWAADELVAHDFPPVRWAVEGYVPEGLTFLVGNPKMGKSWMAMELVLAVATGGVAFGHIPVVKGEALYLALEDNGRRLKNRLLTLTRQWKTPLPPSAHFVTEWERMGKGGLRMLSYWLGQHPDCRLVVIDTLARIKRMDAKAMRTNIYDEDSAIGEALQKVAFEFNVALLVLTHLRKQEAEDVVAMVTSSHGLTGSADAILIVKRARGKPDATMFVTGRDIEEEREVAMKFDKLTAQWTLIGDAAVEQLSSQRRKIVETLEKSQRVMDYHEIAAVTEMKPENCKFLCYALKDDGRIKHAGENKFMALPQVVMQQTLPNTPLTALTALTDITKTNGSSSKSVSASKRVSAVSAVSDIHSNGVTCLDCGQALPEGWLFRCPACLELEEHRIDPD